MAEYPVEVSNLRKSFGSVEVLRDISFRIERGTTACILGGSGSGKSTLLKTMIGILRPTSGSVTIEGEDITTISPQDLDTLRGKFGVMFQSGALLNSLTVAENIALPLLHHTKLGRDTIDIMVKMKLQRVNLLDAADRRPSEISGGMQKRAAVARALAQDPRLLFYDEPSAGLDPIATSSIDKLINDLKTSMRVTNVVVTHVMESVRRIADQIIMIHKGEVYFDGALDDFLASTDQLIKQFVRGDLEGLAAETSSRLNFHRDLLL